MTLNDSFPATGLDYSSLVSVRVQLFPNGTKKTCLVTYEQLPIASNDALISRICTPMEAELLGTWPCLDNLRNQR